MCPACRSERFDSRAVAGITIRRCRECGLRTSVIPPGKQTNYADVDDRAYWQSIARVRRGQAKAIVELACGEADPLSVARGPLSAAPGRAAAGQRTTDNGQREWLDVGCGYGYVLEAAREAGFSIRGLEPDRKAASAARERLGDAIATGTLDESAAPADIISTLDVIEHLEDLDAFAQLVRRKARALWVIKVPSSEGLFFRVAHALRLGRAVKRLWQSEYEHPHRVYFDRPSLTRFLARNGFEVIATRYLAEVPTGTIVDRLTLDGAMRRWQALLAAPLLVAINLVEKLRDKSDALVVVARVTR